MGAPSYGYPPYWTQQLNGGVEVSTFPEEKYRKAQEVLEQSATLTFNDLAECERIATEAGAAGDAEFEATIYFLLGNRLANVQQELALACYQKAIAAWDEPGVFHLSAGFLLSTLPDKRRALPFFQAAFERGAVSAELYQSLTSFLT